MEIALAMIAFEARWDDLVTSAHAWLLFLDEVDGGALRTTCLPWLSAGELERYDALLSERLRYEYLAGVALCRRSLSHYARVDPSQWRFSRKTLGKPKIAAPVECRSLQFSLARTNGLAVCLVTRAGPAGADVENTSRAVDGAAIARHFLSQSELKRLGGLSQERQLATLFKLWVLHEAYVKGTGKGLAGKSERIRVRLGPDDAPLPIANWNFYLYEPSASHVAAAAIRRPHDAPPVSVTWLKSPLFETRITVED